MTNNLTGEELCRLLRGSMEWELVTRLMQGNDAQCFSTLQFADARDQWLCENFAMTLEQIREIDGGEQKHRLESAVKQLREIAPLVTEVKQDVWTLPEYVVAEA